MLHWSSTMAYWRRFGIHHAGQIKEQCLEFYNWCQMIRSTPAPVPNAPDVVVRTCDHYGFYVRRSLIHSNYFTRGENATRYFFHFQRRHHAACWNRSRILKNVYVMFVYQQLLRETGETRHPFPVILWQHA